MVEKRPDYALRIVLSSMRSEAIRWRPSELEPEKYEADDD